MATTTERKKLIVKYTACIIFADSFKIYIKDSFPPPGFIIMHAYNCEAYAIGNFVVEYGYIYIKNCILFISHLFFTPFSVAALFGLLTWWYLSFPNRLQLPYPEGVPFLGNVFQLQPHRSHLRLDEWAQELGSVYALRLFSQNAVVVSDYENLKDILITRGKVFGGRPQDSFRLDLFSHGKQDVAFANPDAKFWSPVRKLVHGHLKLHSGGAAHLEEIFHLSGEDAFDDIRKQEGNPIDIQDILYSFSMRTILILSIGKSMADDKDIMTAMRRMERNALKFLNEVGDGAILDVFPWLRFFGHKTYKQIMLVRKDLHEIYHTVKGTIISHMDEKNPTNVTEALLAMENKMKDADGKPIYNDVNIMANLNDMIIAGVSTTGRSLYAFINILLHHKDVMKNIHKELDKVVDKRKEVTSEDRANMPYMGACIFELLRYGSLNTNGLPHCTMEDTTLAGTVIPKDTVIITNLWTMHHDKNFWGDPWTFRPSRYLTEDGQLVSPDHPNRTHMLIFGAGKRVCLGKQFGMTRLFFFLSNLMSRFELDYGEEPVSCDPCTYQSDLILLQKPYKVRFTPRF